MMMFSKRCPGDREEETAGLPGPQDRGRETAGLLGHRQREETAGRVPVGKVTHAAAQLACVPQG